MSAAINTNQGGAGPDLAPLLIVADYESWSARLYRAAASAMGVATATLNPADMVAPDGFKDLAAVHPMVIAGCRLAFGPISVLDLMEATFAPPTLFPNGNRGMPLALLPWSQATAALDAVHDAPLVLAAAHLVARQLEDGRAFLQGSQPGLADAAAFAALAPHGVAVFDQLEPLRGWAVRIRALEKTGAGNPAALEVCLETSVSSPSPVDNHIAGGVHIHAVRTALTALADQLLVPLVEKKALRITCDRALIE